MKGHVLYNWPWTKHFRFISRCKMYQSFGMTALLVPISYWYANGTIDTSTLVYSYVGVGGVTGVFVAVSQLFTRFVGELALTPERQELRISTLTFMGHRRDRLVPLDHVIPALDSTCRIKSFKRLEVVDSKDVYWYSLKHGRVLDWSALKEVLGLEDENATNKYRRE